MTKTFAIYFPSWHPDEHYRRWYGDGFSEWRLLQSTRPLFEGHNQPLRPQWGYFDEAAPEWMAKQIDWAADHAVDGFLFDWYWYEGEQFLQRPLEEAFLRAPNRNRLEFALMWANHHWGRWPALDEHNRGMNGRENQTATIWLTQRHSPEDCRRMIEYCCRTYFSHPNYWQIDGRVVFSIYDLQLLRDELGGEAEVAAMVNELRQIAARHGHELFLLANVGCCNDNVYCCGYDRVPWAERMGFDAVFAYNIVRSPRYGEIPETHPVYDYSEVIESHHRCWRRMAAWGLPHFPVVTTGLDVSPRWNRAVHFPMPFRELGYEPIVTGNTPERIAGLYCDALAQEAPAVIVNAWNEWSEGMYLLPSVHQGNRILEAMRTVRSEYAL